MQFINNTKHQPKVLETCSDIIEGNVTLTTLMVVIEAKYDEKNSGFFFTKVYSAYKLTLRIMLTFLITFTTYKRSISKI